MPVGSIFHDGVDLRSSLGLVGYYLCFLKFVQLLNAIGIARKMARQAQTLNMLLLALSSDRAVACLVPANNDYFRRNPTKYYAHPG